MQNNMGYWRKNNSLVNLLYVQKGKVTLYLSKFFKIKEVDNNIYAIYNSLLMKIYFVTTKELNNIINSKISNKKIIKQLSKAGILVEDFEKDNIALKYLQQKYKQTFGKVEILYLILSQSCNLGCKYCFLENEFANWKNETMSFDIAKISIDKFNNYLLKNEIITPRIMLYGGEALLNWSTIIKIIEYTEKINSNIVYSIVTNGTLTTKEMIEYLKHHNVSIAISLDGPKDINDKNRVFKNSVNSVYDSVMKTIENLKNSKCRFGLSIALNDELISNNERVISWLNQININDIYYNLFHYGEKSIDWNKHSIESANFIINSHNTLSKQNIYDGRILRQLDSLFYENFKFTDCAAVGRNQISISPNGDMRICHSDYLDEENLIGNIMENNIHDIKNMKNTCFDYPPIMNNDCIECEAIHICGGGCPIQAKHYFKDKKKYIDKAYCLYNKTILDWFLQYSYNNYIEKNGGVEND